MMLATFGGRPATNCGSFCRGEREMGGASSEPITNRLAEQWAGLAVAA